MNIQFRTFSYTSYLPLPSCLRFLQSLLWIASHHISMREIIVITTLCYGRAGRSDLAKVMWQCNVLDRKGTDISGNHCELRIPADLAESETQAAQPKLRAYSETRVPAWCGCDVTTKKKLNLSNNLSRILLEAISKITGAIGSVRRERG